MINLSRALFNVPLSLDAVSTRSAQRSVVKKIVFFCRTRWHDDEIASCANESREGEWLRSTDFYLSTESVGLERWTHNFRFQDDPREYDPWEDGISI